MNDVHRVSDAGGGQLEFTQVKSGEIQKGDFNTAVRAIDTLYTGPI